MQLRFDEQSRQQESNVKETWVFAVAEENSNELHSY